MDGLQEYIAVGDPHGDGQLSQDMHSDLGLQADE